jgi:hypothetical protein
MRFLLLLPEVPRAREDGFPERDLQCGRPRTGCGKLIANVVDVVRNRLGVGYRAPDRTNPRLSLSSGVRKDRSLMPNPVVGRGSLE